MVDEKKWLQALAESREEARDYYLNSFNWRGRPVPNGFDGPRYYPPAPAWCVDARLDSDTPGTDMEVELTTSIGDLRLFDLKGTFLFNVAGKEYRLTAYAMLPRDPDYSYLFVPFRDATSGNETYGGGRYLDVAMTSDDHYILDFNRAYNPSCVYSPRYNCPYPPPENSLHFRVEAGEKMPLYGE
ncbi:MAG: DUF1684 domain-containing protein [Chloroflexota bacterium]|nr:DUF1684 domain-containing protein [Chloroflexota bacterium]